MRLAFGNKPQSALHVTLGRQEQRSFSPHPTPTSQEERRQNEALSVFTKICNSACFSCKLPG